MQSCIFSDTIRSNLKYGNESATEAQLEKAVEMSRCLDMVKRLPQGYDTVLYGAGDNISQGQRQLLTIARIFVNVPKILILDEATSALDNESEQHIQKSLDALSENRTTITIAHRLSTIQNADEILVIDGQTIKERGTHEELIASGGLYAKYYHMM